MHILFYDYFFMLCNRKPVYNLLEVIEAEALCSMYLLYVRMYFKKHKLFSKPQEG